MKLRDAELLARYMEAKDFSQARLGRYAGVSRQFIHKLVSGETRTCSDGVGRLIEEGLSVLPGTLFTPEQSIAGRPSVTQRTTVVRRARVSARSSQKTAA